LVFSLTVKSTQEALTTGTLKAIPVIFPFNSGITLVTALAAPVDDGMMLFTQALPILKSLPIPSTEF